MPRHLRNLLLIAALCWVAPVSAQAVHSDASECPYAKAARAEVVIADVAPGEVPVSPGRRVFLP